MKNQCQLQCNDGHAAQSVTKLLDTIQAIKGYSDYCGEVVVNIIRQLASIYKPLTPQTNSKSGNTVKIKFLLNCKKHLSTLKNIFLDDINIKLFAASSSLLFDGTDCHLRNVLAQLSKLFAVQITLDDIVANQVLSVKQFFYPLFLLTKTGQKVLQNNWLPIEMLAFLLAK